MIGIPHQILFGDQIKNIELGRTCGMYGGEENCTVSFDGKT
jgi:hypothetical protein